MSHLLWIMNHFIDVLSKTIKNVSSWHYSEAKVKSKHSRVFFGPCYAVSLPYLVKIPRRDMTVTIDVALHVFTALKTKHWATSANRSSLRMRWVGRSAKFTTQRWPEQLRSLMPDSWNTTALSKDTDQTPLCILRKWFLIGFLVTFVTCRFPRHVIIARR